MLEPAELLSRAQDGDPGAFDLLVAPHRAELQVHCYRMLGSLQDAEDTLQETLLAAWVGLGGFEGRSSVRTWLYRIATHRCLNALRSSSRRPVPAEPLPVQTPAPSSLGQVTWLQPCPDVLLDGVPDTAPGPEARYEAREAISLAFVTAVQLLPPAGRAALLLRDVLGYRARETAELLETSEDAVASSLKRARAALRSASVPSAADGPPPAGGPVERELLDRFVTHFVDLDVAALLALMTDDVWLRMPPQPLEYRGRAAVGAFLEAIAPAHAELVRMVAVRANRRPAWGGYSRDRTTGLLHLTGLFAVDLAGDRISELTRFETAVAGHLGLPRTLEG